MMTKEQILIILSWYIQNTLDTDSFEAYVVLQGFKNAITGSMTFEELCDVLHIQQGRR